MYGGKVEAYDADTGLHTVLCDDGETLEEVSAHELHNEEVRRSTLRLCFESRL